jgi:23S rRNA (cytidine1920-2'-O)/16S rRNA (cytidine1409-2'-O)-methyltransferase
MSSTAKQRIDQILFAKGLAPSRERAQAMVMAGLVLVNDQPVAKASQKYLPKAITIRIKGKDHPFVGRGGVKLAGALDHFGIQIQDQVCLDIGASTGGFTDCLLQRGAVRVYTFDSGSNQLAYSLRENPRVICRENFNVKYLTSQDIPEPISWVTMDVSFISVTQLIPPLIQALPGPWQGLFLIKPQFEAGKGVVPKGGVLPAGPLVDRILEDVRKFCEKSGLKLLGQMPSVLKGDKGNQEYFIWLKAP